MNLNQHQQRTWYTWLKVRFSHLPFYSKKVTTPILCMTLLYAAVRHGVLAKFNYVRPDYNILHYGQVTPPVYNLSNIPHDLPLFISYGGQDALSDVRDVENLLDQLKFHDVDKRSVQFVKEYAHADYIMGFNAKDIVYNSVISFFNSQGNT